MMSSHRSTQSAFVCSPTTYFEDLAALEEFVKRYKQLGGKLPPAIENAMELAKAGKHAEDAMNIACDGLFKFYLDAETQCAKDAGFSGLEDLARNGGERWQEREQIYDPCIAAVARQWQATNVSFTLNLANRHSALRAFLENSAKQITEIVTRYLKKQTLNKKP